MGLPHCEYTTVLTATLVFRPMLLDHLMTRDQRCLPTAWYYFRRLRRQFFSLLSMLMHIPIAIANDLNGFVQRYLYRSLVGLVCSSRLNTATAVVFIHEQQLCCAHFTAYRGLRFTRWHRTLVCCDVATRDTGTVPTANLRHHLLPPLPVFRTPSPMPRCWLFRTVTRYPPPPGTLRLQWKGRRTKATLTDVTWH